MATFKDIIGHEQIIMHLGNALKNKTISHAYIFNGEDGVGKNMLARAFAKAIECEAGYGDSCDMCRSCQQVETNNHPDIRWITHEKPNSIGTSEIKEQLNNDIDIKPYSSKYKVYIVDEAEKMTPQAQNSILKTIEEPPAYGVIILLTNRLESLLPTIKSRCVILNIKAVAQEKIQKFLMDKYQVPDYKARVCAGFSQGNVGKAVKMATSVDFNELQEDILRLVKRLDSMAIYEIMDTVKNMAEHKADIYDIIDMMMVWYRDVLMLKITNDMNLLVFKSEYKALSQQAQKLSFDGINDIIEGMEKAKVRLLANVNFDVALEMMLLTIKES